MPEKSENLEGNQPSVEFVENDDHIPVSKINANVSVTLPDGNRVDFGVAADKGTLVNSKVYPKKFDEEYVRLRVAEDVYIAVNRNNPNSAFFFSSRRGYLCGCDNLDLKRGVSVNLRLLKARKMFKSERNVVTGEWLEFLTRLGRKPKEVLRKTKEVLGSQKGDQ